MTTAAASDLYPILPWDPLHGWDGKLSRKAGLDTIAACNFTVAGFVQPGDLRQCEQLGLAAIILDDSFAGAQPPWGRMSDQEIDETVKRWADQTAHSPATLGYYVYDEPGAKDFSGLARIVAAVKRIVPGKLAYINLFPNYASTGPDSQLQTDTYEEHLERFAREVEPQFLSWDNYQIQYSLDMAKPELVESYYSNLMQVREVAARYSLPFWHIVSPVQIHDKASIPTPANLAFQAYTTLASGASSVGWYTYNSHEGYNKYAPIESETGAKTPTWYYLAEVNRQVKLLGPILNRLHSTGVYFTPPTQVSGLPTLPEDYPLALEATTPLMVGEFSGADGQYYLLANLSLERSARVTPRLRGEASLELCSLTDGSFRGHASAQALWLPAGQGALLRIPGNR